MKKIYLATLLAVLSASPAIAADNKPTGLIGYVDAILSIPGNTFMYVNSSFLKSIAEVIESIATSFNDASDGVIEAGNVANPQMLSR